MFKTEFDIKYAKQSFLKEAAADIVYYRILSGSLIVTFLIIIILTNIEFENTDEHIKRQFKEYVLGLSTESPIQKPEKKKTNTFSTQNQNAEKKALLDDNTKAQKIPQPTIKIGEIEIDELSYEGEDDGAGITPRPITRQQRGEVKLEMDGLMQNNLFEYEIERNANLYIPEPVNESAETEKFGYRDQEEVYRVIETKSVNIESCYQKAARFGMVKSGYVKVQFQITADGFILPHSIRVIKSTLRNKAVEQCIKKTIRRLRGFEKLDKSRGTARVTHKFVFN